MVLGQFSGRLSAKDLGKLVFLTACKVSSGQVENPEHRHDQNEHFSNAKRIHKMHRVTVVNEFWLGDMIGDSQRQNWSKVLIFLGGQRLGSEVRADGVLTSPWGAGPGNTVPAISAEGVLGP